MKTICAKIVCVILGFISCSVLYFGLGIHGSSSYTGFAPVRDQIVYEFLDLYNTAAFHISDDNIRSKTLTKTLPNDARCYEVNDFRGCLG